VNVAFDALQLLQRKEEVSSGFLQIFGALKKITGKSMCWQKKSRREMTPWREMCHCTGRQKNSVRCQMGDIRKPAKQIRHSTNKGHSFGPIYKDWRLTLRNSLQIIRAFRKESKALWTW